MSTSTTFAPVQIGILGATGPAGSGLAARLASVGFEVVVGSRSRYRAMEVRDSLLERWSGRSLAIEAADNDGAASAEVVVIATPVGCRRGDCEVGRDAVAGQGRHLDGQRAGQGRP